MRSRYNHSRLIVYLLKLTYAKDDLHRLLLSTGLSPAAIAALGAFEASALDRFHQAAANSAPLPPRKPPVGALISAARIIQQLLSEKCKTTPLPTEDEIANKWPSEDVNKRAFAKALIDVYARRQRDRNLGKVGCLSYSPLPQ